MPVFERKIPYTGYFLQNLNHLKNILFDFQEFRLNIPLLYFRYGIDLLKSEQLTYICIA